MQPLMQEAPRPPQALQRESLHAQVAEHLRQMILQGTLAPGAQLKLADLGARLDVSPTPLREALKVLAEEQLIELTRNGPARVAPVRGADVQALFEVMAGIEALAAELAAKRMDDAALAHLAACHGRMRGFHEADAREAYFATNREVHNLIIRYAANPVLAHLRGKLALRTERVRLMAVRRGSRRSQAMEEHEAAMAAFRARDAALAGRLWREHLIRSGEDMCRILELDGARGESPPEEQAPAGSSARERPQD